MSREEKSPQPETRKRQTGTLEQANEQRSAARAKTDVSAWPTAKKLGGADKKIDARRKVPSGPLGGSGRKTNLSRSR